MVDYLKFGGKSRLFDHEVCQNQNLEVESVGL